MFKKRHQRLKRMTEEIEKLRGAEGDTTSDAKPRRVTDDAFFSRIEEIQSSGGKWAHGEI